MRYAIIQTSYFHFMCGWKDIISIRYGLIDVQPFPHTPIPFIFFRHYSTLIMGNAM